MGFIVSSVAGRVFGIIISIAIGGVILLVTRGDVEQEKSSEQSAREQAEKATTVLGDDADSIAAGVELADLRTNLKVIGEWQRYGIKRVEPNNGGYTIETALPPGQASIRKVARLCERILGGDSPLVDAPAGLLVFGTGPEPLSGKSCGQGP